MLSNIFNYTLEELELKIKESGLPSYRASQIWNWIYTKGIIDFSLMKNISAKDQDILVKNFSISLPQIHTAQSSCDGTQKWLFNFFDNNKAETVHIPEKTRGTLCISSQIGCTLTCSFCHTGTQVLVRNLEASEIVSQVFYAKKFFNEFGDVEKKHLTNIVLMGMGEPLYNYDNVAKAIKILTNESGINFSKRKITLSTSGIVPLISKCAQDLGVSLAISLHATNNTLRNELVPINKKYPLEELIKACKEYPKLSNSRRITFEYVMLKNVNDSLDDAKALVKLIKGIPSKINLIPFNPWPGSKYECSDLKTMENFSNYLYKAGYTSPIRKTRGDDILAACGQLKSNSLRIKKSAN